MVFRSAIFFWLSTKHKSPGAYHRTRLHRDQAGVGSISRVIVPSNRPLSPVRSSDLGVFRGDGLGNGSSQYAAAVPGSDGGGVSSVLRRSLRLSFQLRSSLRRRAVNEKFDSLVSIVRRRQVRLFSD